MINKHILEKVKDRLIKTYKLLKIYLFGSYAWGFLDEESDLDLLVVIDTYNKNSHETLVEGHRALFDLNISKDILIYSKEEWDTFSKDNTKFSYKIRKEGKLIYGEA